MIPKFNEFGYLPKGIYKASIKTIEEKFGSTTAKRKVLFQGFKSLVKILVKYKDAIKQLILNGSFVSNREHPNDFDCLLIVKDNFDIYNPDAEKLLYCKEYFQGDLLIIPEKYRFECRQRIKALESDKDGIAKGFLEVIL